MQKKAAPKGGYEPGIANKISLSTSARARLTLTKFGLALTGFGVVDAGAGGWGRDGAGSGTVAD